MKKQFLWMAGAALLAGTFLFNANSVQAEDAGASAETIATGVYIGAVDVGGMTADQAHAAIDDYVSGLMDTTFTLKGANGSIEATAEEMGITADADATVESALNYSRTGNLIERFEEAKDLESQNKVLPLALEVDKQETAALLYTNRDQLSIEAVDGTLKRVNGSFEYVAGSEGEELDEVQSVYAINNFLAYEYDGSSTDIDLVCNTVEPKGTEEELSVIQDCLGTFTTDYSSSAAGRKANVENAASKIDGSVIYPGEEFSVYEAITPMTIENGYELAGAYENGTVVSSVGGGVCQVATTLYNAIIRAELDVTMRFNHSMLVSYVSPSDDAAIAGTYKDLRFKNNTDTPVYISADANGYSLTFSVYGVETRPANREVSFVSETVEQDEATLKFNTDSSQELGYYNVEQSAHLRTVAQLYKVVTVDGVEQSRELFNSSTYNASPKTITVGTAGCTDAQLKLITDAIAKAEESGDESLVESAISAAKALAEDDKDDDADDDGKDDDDKDKDSDEDSDDGDDSGKKDDTDTPDTTSSIRKFSWYQF